MFAQTNRLFCTAFSKAVARAALAQKTAFSFCKAFSFVPLVAKEKAIKDKQRLGLVSLFLDTKTL